MGSEGHSRYFQGLAIPPAWITVDGPPTKESVTECLEEEIRDFVWDRLPEATTLAEAGNIVDQIFRLIADAWPENDEDIPEAFGDASTQGK